MRNLNPSTALAATVALCAGIAAAAAQPAEPNLEPVVDIEVPSLILDIEGTRSDGPDHELDLANLVQSAAKQVTTVQEAPAIVTVIPSKEIEDRGLTSLADVVDLVPGWMRNDYLNNNFPFVLPRGQVQAALVMQNGLSMFSPLLNDTQSIQRLVPVETIDRVEVVTGPGGVLWGANSYLGIVNVMTKDWDDVEGIEAEAAFGDGRGDENVFRAYVMGGATEVLHEDINLFVHGSFQTYGGPRFSYPRTLLGSSAPQPVGPEVYGAVVESSTPQSSVFLLDGKLGLGKLELSWWLPYAETHMPLGFAGAVNEHELPEDQLPECSQMEPNVPGAFDPADACYDRARLARENRADFVDRYGMARYRDRFAGGRAGVDAKAYLVQFYRDYKSLLVLPGSRFLEGGLAISFDGTAYRAGSAIDADVRLPGNLNLLYGVEAFHEWMPSNVERARHGAGVEGTIANPEAVNRLNLPCPVQPTAGEMPGTERIEGCPFTFAFAAERTVLGTYVNPQWRPQKGLILDGGARLQVAPEALGSASYAPRAVFSGGAVYRFAPDWHLKLSYAEGFRPPVFNNTHSNGDAIQIEGDRDLEVESSQAGQAEINARLLRNRGDIRELTLRADYSYTRLENLIQIINGHYANTGKRDIHSAEALAKLYVRGGHRIELGYTWLQVNMADQGRHRALPEHWFNLSGVFSLIPNALETSATLRVMGSMEDPNMMIEHRDLEIDPESGRTVMAGTDQETERVVRRHEVVLDRLPPSADLRFGLTYTGIEDLRLSGYVYNAFDTHHYNADPTTEFIPGGAFLPNPYPGFRFLVKAAYTY